MTNEDDVNDDNDDDGGDDDDGNYNDDDGDDDVDDLNFYIKTLNIKLSNEFCLDPHFMHFDETFYGIITKADMT